VLNAIAAFDSLSWRSPHRDLHSLIIAFPDLTETTAMLLDDLHDRLKDDVVRAGLMFAQFHPRCNVRSVRNGSVLVGCAPVPMLAFRRMAEHDILFLYTDAEWFGVYRSHFGHRFTAQEGIDSAVMQAFTTASRRYCGGAGSSVR
jgi:heptaprenyl diphosphate synthase